MRIFVRRARYIMSKWERRKKKIGLWIKVKSPSLLEMFSMYVFNFISKYYLQVGWSLEYFLPKYWEETDIFNHPSLWSLVETVTAYGCLFCSYLRIDHHFQAHNIIMCHLNCRNTCDWEIVRMDWYFVYFNRLLVIYRIRERSHISMFWRYNRGCRLFLTLPFSVIIS